MVEFVEFEGPKGTLRGTLHVPDSEGPVPGVVMMHGLGAERMECRFLFVKLSRAFEAAGIASLRFDFYGSGESDGDFIEMTASSERADALVAIDYFKSLAAIDADRVGLMGMSFGGYMTALTIGGRPDIKAASLWAAAATTSRRWRERVTDQDRRSLQQRGWLDLSGMRLSRDFVDDLDNHRPCEEVVRYNGPVLVVHGTDDQMVPFSIGKEYVRVLETRPHAVTEHLYVEGGDHPWTRWEFRQQIYDRTVAWFQEHL